MNLKQQLIETLEALAPQIVDKDRALLERDKAAISISSLLSESQGLNVVEYICDELKYGKTPLYSASDLLPKTKVEQMIEHFYVSSQQPELNILLSLYDQFWRQCKQDADTKHRYDALMKLQTSPAVSSQTLVLKCCPACFQNLDQSMNACSKCGENRVFEVFRLFLEKSARSVLKNRQYLELYVKDCMKKSGIELVGCEAGKNGNKVYTSIRYQIEGELIDVDLLGISTAPLALLLCEVKTSEKISPNELRRIEGLFTRFTNKVHKLSEKDFDCLNIFVTSGEFDQNIPTRAYRRKGWELLDRNNIPNLVDQLTQIQKEI